MSRFVGRVLGIPYRDFLFWTGLSLIWAGVAGYRSPFLASAIVGALLFSVAIFGVAPSRGS